MSLLTEKEMSVIVQSCDPLSIDTRSAAERFSDRTWRLNHLYYILDVTGKKIRFTMNEAQEDLLNECWYLNLILKARQLGFTTFICILFLDVCLFNSNLRAGIIAHNREDSQEFFENKVQFAYDNLPDVLKAARPTDTDRANKLSFNNGSSIRVGTSLRSGTYNYLHVSEFGKICARFPEKAREIVTGAFNTIHAGQYIFVESTAEGREGYFHDYCSEAENRQLSGILPNKLQFKLHFYAWWKCLSYVMDPATVFISQDLKAYFAELRDKHSIVLTPEQEAWYAAKASTQGEDMYREFPSTPAEAFKASVEGAYYQVQMAQIRKHRMITRVSYTPGIPVNTGWDLGYNDDNAIWFHQRVGIENRIIDYYKNSGEDLEHYVRILQERGYIYGRHFLPHDATHGSLKTGSKSVVTILEEFGIKNIEVVARTNDRLASIDETRRFLSTCWIDQEKCDEGIKCLDSYRKEWDLRTGAFKNTPLHDWASNGADALRSLACGFDNTSAMAAGGAPKGKSRRRPGGMAV